MLSTRDPLQTQGHIQTESEGTKVFHANRMKRKLEQQYLLSDKTDFKIKTVKRQKRTLHNDKGINPKSIYNNCKCKALNIGGPRYIKQILINVTGEIDNNTVIVGDYTPLTSMARPSRHKINQKTSVLDDTSDQMELNIYGTFHPKEQNTHSFQVHMEHSPGQITCYATK